MPRSILVLSLLLIVGGGGIAIGEGMDLFTVGLSRGSGLWALAAGVGLLLRQRWARILTSILIVYGYLVCASFLLSALGGHSPFWQMLGALAVVGVLTLISGDLWSRETSVFFAAPSSRSELGSRER